MAFFLRRYGRPLGCLQDTAAAPIAARLAGVANAPLDSTSRYLALNLQWTIGVDGPRKSQMDQPGKHYQHEQRDDASFRPRRTSRQPTRPVRRGVQKPALAKKPAICRALEKSLRPIPGCVETYHEPEVASASDHQAEKHSDPENIQKAERRFAPIGDMSHRKYRR